MNQQERDALREKHQPYWVNDIRKCEYCYWWNERLYQADRAEWPCDVIKVLDATEPAATECGHVDYIYVANPESPAIGDGYIGTSANYCPKCGEKL